MVLDSLGVAGDTDSRARLVEDLDDLVKETVDDLYLRAFAFDDGGPVFTHDEALAIARTRRRRPPGPARARGRGPHHAGRPPGQLRATRSATEMDRRKRRLGDPVLRRPAQPARRRARRAPTAPAGQRMRQRWQIVLVDEFQDTDPVQWQVLDRAFTGHATMVLIGDPKQAIYAFRGGDVTTYLQAAETAATQQTLSVNWRSDAAAARLRSSGCSRGAALGDERIVVRDVEAHHPGSRLAGAPRPRRSGCGWCGARTFGARGAGTLTVGQVRPHIARDLALDVRRLLASGATFDGRADPAARHRGDQLPPRRPGRRPGGARRRSACPAVIAGGGSVFATPAAVEWLTPARGARAAAPQPPGPGGRAHLLLRPHRRRARRRRRRPHRRGRRHAARWVELFATRGIAAVLEAATVARAARRGCWPRSAASAGSPTCATSARRCTRSTLTERHGLVSLLTWLREQVAEGRAGRGAERTRRLDSDAAAVQLVTIHASKGLEYPVVYLPAVADRFVAEADPAAVPRRRRAALRQRRRRRRRLGRPLPPLGRTRRPASGCGCCTSPSPAPSPRSSAGGRRPRTPSPRRCTGC